MFCSRMTVLHFCIFLFNFISTAYAEEDLTSESEIIVDIDVTTERDDIIITVSTTDIVQTESFDVTETDIQIEITTKASVEQDEEVDDLTTTKIVADIVTESDADATKDTENDVALEKTSEATVEAGTVGLETVTEAVVHTDTEEDIDKTSKVITDTNTDATSDINAEVAADKDVETEVDAVSDIGEKTVGDISEHAVADTNEEAVADTNEEVVVDPNEDGVADTNGQAVADTNEEVVVDRNEEVVANMNEEAAADTNEEAAADTNEEAAADTNEEAAADTNEEAAADTNEEAAADTNEEAVSDQNEETVADTNKEVVFDPNEEGVVDTNVEAVTDTNVEAVTDTNEEAASDQNEETVADTNEEAVADTNVEAVADTNEKSVADTNDEAVADTNEEVDVAATTQKVISADETSEILDLNVDNGFYSEPVGNILALGQFRNKNYYYSDGFKVNYFQANQICKDLGMRIISVNSKQQNDFLTKNIKKLEKHHRFWTSASNFLNGKNWIWMATGQPVEYTNWTPGKPSENNKHCIEIVFSNEKDLKWSNEDCNEKLSFVCEMEGILLHPTQIGLTNLLGVVLGSLIFPVLSYNKKRYYAVNDLELSFFDAARACQMIGLELVSVKSEEENNKLYEHIRNSMAGTNFWSGGTRIKDGTNWYWLSSGQKLTYTNWQDGQPENDDTKCLQLIFQTDVLEWNRINCDIPQNFICETSNYRMQAKGEQKVVESIPNEINQLVPSTIKIKVIAPSQRKYP